MNVEEVTMDKRVIGFLSPEQDAYLHNSLAGRDVGITKKGCQIGVAGLDLEFKDGDVDILSNHPHFLCI
jgi:hypothetical protein